MCPIMAYPFGGATATAEQFGDFRCDLPFFATLAGDSHQPHDQIQRVDEGRLEGTFRHGLDLDCRVLWTWRANKYVRMKDMAATSPEPSFSAPPTSSRHLLDPASGLQEWLAARGEKAFRVRQIRHGIFAGRADSIERISELPKALRTALEAEFTLWSTSVARKQVADDGTEKLLLNLRDGGQIECVLLRDGLRRTICVSSQVGCGMGCVFCASGLDGLARNLTTGEILEQMLQLRRLLPVDERLSHIVMMGMGEPLANLERVLAALDVAAVADGLGISPRRITISTVGLPAAMDRLTAAGRPFNLAVSLHAPNDEIRSRIVPTNPGIGLAEILAASDRYLASSGRRLTFEYVLLGGLNDAPEHAEELAGLLRGRIALLNVIPYNPVAGLTYRTPSPQAVLRFRDVLLRRGIEVKFRQRKGDAIQAACGQLRRNSALPATPEQGLGVQVEWTQQEEHGGIV